MKVGIQFPSSTIGQNPVDVRAFAIDTERVGFHHLSYGEHILWAVKGEGDARANHTYHDVLTTMAYHAAVTTKIELFAAIFVLPQRQAQIVAKQCAQVDLLSGGRVRAAGPGVRRRHDRSRRGAHRLRPGPIEDHDAHTMCLPAGPAPHPDWRNDGGLGRPAELAPACSQ